jgi:hypothetical protein
MISTTWPGNPYWPQWQRILFRFLFVYFLLMIAPWTWLEYIPGVSYVMKYYYQLSDALVQFANNNIFKVYKELVRPNGSGDTSWAYTQMWLYLLLSAFVCIVWTVIDRKNTHYNRIAYWFRIILRYFLIVNCFGYGFAKVFLQQMPFPNMSQLATPLGDLLPMRLSWIFMGYSSNYQFFTGLMEVIAGLLLLFRRTSTFGTFFAAGVFANVFVMNLGYDIPVKLYSLHLFLSAMILMLFDYKRMLQFLMMNRTADVSHLYEVTFPLKWMRITRILLKLFVITTTIIIPLYGGLFPGPKPKASSPIPSGVYHVDVFVKNGDTIPYTYTDSLRWKDFIIEANGSGSVGSRDTTFRQLYGRGYFGSKADTATNELKLNKRDWVFNIYELFTLKYSMPDSTHLILHGKMRNDSIYVQLTKTNRHFQLAERQFHWLSEYNR